MRPRNTMMWVLLLSAWMFACGGGEESGGERSAGRGGPEGAAPGEWVEARWASQTAVPVEASAVERRSISSYIETNGTLEAENEVDIVARVAGPIVRLEAEETDVVLRGELLAAIDASEIEAQLEISRVALEEANLAFERAERLKKDALVSAEAYEDAKAAYESAQAQFEGNEIQLGYTQIRAPFDGQIIERSIKFAQHVRDGDRLFRISDFDPLLCPIQVPERNIPQLEKGQRAFLSVEAWPEDRFEARVLRLSPVVDAATGTVRVTLEVRGEGRLRPGMFASVFLETETRDDALVIPKTALAIDSIGDTVFVVGDGIAQRREVTLGFREGDAVEVLAGVEEGEQVVTVGQDGLADGTPVQVLGPGGPPAGPPGGQQLAGGGGPPGPAGPSSGGEGAPGGLAGGERPDISQMSPEQIERMKERMRSMGMSDEQIEKRIEQLREQQKKAAGS